jgi:hypothetical protein
LIDLYYSLINSNSLNTNIDYNKITSVKIILNFSDPSIITTIYINWNKPEEEINKVWLHCRAWETESQERFPMKTFLVISFDLSSYTKSCFQDKTNSNRFLTPHFITMYVTIYFSLHGWMDGWIWLVVLHMCRNSRIGWDMHTFLGKWKRSMLL